MNRKKKFAYWLGGILLAVAAGKKIYNAVSSKDNESQEEQAKEEVWQDTPVVWGNWPDGHSIADVRRGNIEGWGFYLAPRGQRLHKGVDLNYAPGAAVISETQGKFVKFTSDNNGRGKAKYIIIANDDGTFSSYMYVKNCPLKLGARVGPGDIIGYAADLQALKDNYAGVPNHVHFAVMSKAMGGLKKFSDWEKYCIDPVPYLAVVRLGLENEFYYSIEFRSVAGKLSVDAVWEMVKSRTIDSSGISYDAAILEYRNKNYQEAAEIFKALVVNQPDNALLRNDLAITLIHLGKYDDALVHINEILERIKDSKQFAAAYYNRGLAYERKGNLSKALADYRLAVANGNKRAQKDVTRVTETINQSLPSNQGPILKKSKGR